MSGIEEGQRYLKRGNHRHVWVVDAIIQRRDRPGYYALLVSEDGTSEEEVDIASLADRNLYQPVPAHETKGV